MNFENTRYNRQLMMPEWGAEGQKRVAQATVGVVGAGGVKSTLLMALAACGVGSIRFCEFDQVEVSNLNRQCLYSTGDIGIPKGLAAQKFLRQLNPEVCIEWRDARITSDNIDEHFAAVDIVVEGGDSPLNRNAVNDYCLRASKPMVHASAQYSYGYVCSVCPDACTACLACFFPDEIQRGESTGPVPVNVLSVQLAGTLGAAEVLKWILGYRDQMYVNGRFCFSSLLLSGCFEMRPQVRRPDCPICGPIYRSRGR